MNMELDLTRPETKVQISRRMSFEEIYSEISSLKIRQAETDVILTRVNNEESSIRSEIQRWTNIASIKRKELVTPPTN